MFCVPHKDLQTNSITTGQSQENMSAHSHMIASELMKKITVVSFVKYNFSTEFDIQQSLIHFIILGQLKNTSKKMLAPLAGGTKGACLVSSEAVNQWSKVASAKAFVTFTASSPRTFYILPNSLLSSICCLQLETSNSM